MKKDPFQAVRRICVHLGIHRHDNEIREICRKTSFAEMKSRAENAHPDGPVCSLTAVRRLVFRKGTVGEWRHYFTNKQNRLFDETYNRKMASSSLAKTLLYDN